MTLLQALFLAFVQGITELFPVSSLGHAVIIPAVLRWRLDERSDFFLPFLTFLHFGTLVALFSYFWKDWHELLMALLGRQGVIARLQAVKTLTRLVVATLPAVLVGALLEHRLRALFGAPLIVAFFLIANGFLLLSTEWIRSRQPAQERRSLEALRVRDALLIGLWQCLALIPGLSRSGSTINAGLIAGMSHETAARFSLLMAQPIVFGATVHEAFELRHLSIDHETVVLSCSAALVAGLTAYGSTYVLLRYFRDHTRWALSPFAFYCIAAGLATATALMMARP